MIAHVVLGGRGEGGRSPVANNANTQHRISLDTSTGQLAAGTFIFIDKMMELSKYYCTNMLKKVHKA